MCEIGRWVVLENIFRWSSAQCLRASLRYTYCEYRVCLEYSASESIYPCQVNKTITEIYTSISHDYVYPVIVELDDSAIDAARICAHIYRQSSPLDMRGSRSRLRCTWSARIVIYSVLKISLIKRLRATELLRRSRTLRMRSSLGALQRRSALCSACFGARLVRPRPQPYYI